MCCSQYVRDTLLNAGKLNKNSGVLFGGIDPNPFLNHPINNTSLHQSLKLLYFGALIPAKGVQTSIEALGKLKEMNLLDKVELTLLGSGHPDYVSRLQEQCKVFGLEGKVKFAGRVSRKDVPEWLNNFDVFLFTSIWPEPMARTVMEAMAAGLVVIGSEVGGQKEMLCDEVNSLTFQPEDAYGLAKQIRRVIQDPIIRVQSGTKR